MAMIERESSQSFTSNYSDDTGNVVLTLQAQYGKGIVMFTASMFNQQYIQDNKAEIETAETEFLSRLNERLAESSLPQLHAE